MKWTALESKMLSAAAYEDSKQILYLRFRNTGEVYRYFEFPALDYQAFLSAESRGRFFRSHIRDHFRYERHGQTSRRLITKRHFSRTQAPLCGEDLLDPSADSERLTCHRSPELRKDRLTSGLGPPDAPIAS